MQCISTCSAESTHETDTETIKCFSHYVYHNYYLGAL